MKNIVFIALMAFIYFPLKAQNKLTVYIKDASSKEALTGASAVVEGTTNGATADANGLVTINSIPDGKQIIKFSFIGYSERSDTILFPYNDTLIVFLNTEGDELEEVVISSTRSSRTISDIPTRVEFIAGEELDEKANMKPGDIRMALSESTGIQTQQTSATSANSSIRIQGLDGRYTQILKDGFPLFSGYSGGLGLLQTPPLDLKQIEVIKGSASTLYGGGAISGLVNLISKTPSKERELRFLVNGTSAGGLDVNGFYSKQLNKKFGITLFASRNSNLAYDPAKIDLSAIPKFERYTFNPKLFFNFTEKTKLMVGLNAGLENRIGGDMHYIKGNGDSLHSYFEKNNTQRISTQLAFEHEFGKCSHITFKNSYNSFNRLIQIPNYTFNGTQNATYSELNYSNHGEKTEWIVGLNLWTDQFNEKKFDTIPLRDYNQITYGAFIQNTTKATKWLHIETGLRVDQVVNYDPVILPRLSLLFKITPKITSRLGGGFGYKAPTIFTEESERIQYQNVMPINSSNVLEKSYGANWDVNYRTGLFDNKVTFNINQLFFYTYLDRPLLLQGTSQGLYELVNIKGHIDSRGTETNIKIGYGDFKLYLGYTYTDTKTHVGDSLYIKTLTPKNRINAVLFYEVEDKWKIGLEGYYFSPQKLGDGTTGRDYWLCGFMVEKLWEKLSIYLNFENFLDVRQTRFESIYTGAPTNPTFRDIYAPLDGFVVNGGIKIRL
ncbi:MAG TPA: TonB-dependent receptor [Chitinophagales bacterium]|nr:TonB-dependent receptor [Chitinophagales bacterium]